MPTLTAPNPPAPNPPAPNLGAPARTRDVHRTRGFSASTPLDARPKPDDPRTRVHTSAPPTPGRSTLLRAADAQTAVIARDGGPAPLHLTDQTARQLRDAHPLGAPAGDLATPDLQRLCCSVVRTAVEVMRGERPTHQLVRWVSPTIHEALVRRTQIVARQARLAGNPSTGLRPVTVLSSRLVRLGERVAEASVTISDHDRVRAGAVRVEATSRGIWQVVALEIG